MRAMATGAGSRRIRNPSRRDPTGPSRGGRVRYARQRVAALTDGDNRFVDEFELIRRCFRGCTRRQSGTVLGIGDDAALLDTGGLPLDHARATTPFRGSDDAIATARHVFGAAFIRLAAQGVTPRWATLGLTLKSGEPDSIEAFAAAAAAVCNACEVELIGGDTTGGPGRATVFALGTRRTPSPRTTALPPAAAFQARLLRLEIARAPEHAIADLVSVCIGLAARGAEVRCSDVPGLRGAARPGTLELVVRADAAAMAALRTATHRLRPEPGRFESDG